MPDETSPANPKRLFTRRKVLTGIGGVVGAGALGVGGFLLVDKYDRFGRSADRTIRDHRVELTATRPRMVIARGLDPARSVRAAVERLGGMSAFVGPTDVVVVKPNMGWDRTAEIGRAHV